MKKMYVVLNKDCPDIEHRRISDRIVHLLLARAQRQAR
jgi:hypothetical protein